MHKQSRDALAAALDVLDARLAEVSDGGDANQISEGCYAVGTLLDHEPALRRAFTDPASSPDSRRGLAERLLTGQLPPQPLEVFQDLVARRWETSADLREAVERIAASAALRAAEADGQLDEVEDELFRFGRLLEREPALRAALTDPGLPDDRKTALLADLLSGATPVTLRLIELAVTRPHGGSLEQRLDALSALAAQRRDRYVAKVRVARDLDDDLAERLSRALARLYGRQVELQVDVDPDVLGGLEVRVGDEIVNGTIAAQLSQAARRFSG